MPLLISGEPRTGTWIVTPFPRSLFWPLLGENAPVPGSVTEQIHWGSSEPCFRLQDLTVLIKTSGISPLAWHLGEDRKPKAFTFPRIFY